MLWVTLAIFLLLIKLNLNLSTAQVYGYDCSNRYIIRSSGNFSRGGDGSNSCKDSCLQATPALVVSTPDCTLLQHILQSYNSVIPEGDCLELQFMPGEYRLSSLSKIQVNYSMVLNAPWGGVSMACSEDPEDSCDSQGVEKGRGQDGGQIDELDGATQAGFVMMAIAGSQTRAGFAAIHSLYFTDCTKKLQFSSLNNVTITNSTFERFSISVLDLFDVDNVIIKDSMFVNCSSKTANDKYRANGGAVSVAYSYSEDTRSAVFPEVHISGCMFVNNSVFIANPDQLNQALVNNTYSGRGGGLSIIVQGTRSNVLFQLEDSSFIGNWAQAYGGGLYVLIDGEGTYHRFRLHNCSFLGNFGGIDGFGGGTLFSLLLRNLDNESQVQIEIDECYFERNLASAGAGFAVVEVYSQGKGNVLSMSNTKFVGNQASVAGAAVMLQTFSYVQNRLQRLYYNFTDCVFSNNEALGGTFSTGFNNINFFGTIQFSGNVGPALRLVGALLHVHGNVTFVGNAVPTHAEGGALFIQAFGQVKVEPGTSLTFINNTGGRIGAAIVVEVQRSSPVFSELIYNPQCFLINKDPTLQPHEWIGVRVQFYGNEAGVGPVVFSSHLQHCSWYESVLEQTNVTNEFITLFSIAKFPRWPIFDYDNSNRAFSHKDESSEDRYYFQTQPIHIVASGNDDLVMRAGQTQSVGLNGLDQFGNPTYLIARVSDNRSITNLGAFTQARPSQNTDEITDTVVFEPSLLPVDPAKGVANLTFGFNNREAHARRMDNSVPVIVETTFNILEQVKVPNFNISLSHCQPGYELMERNGIFLCECSNREMGILTCNRDAIVLRDGTWAGKDLGLDPHLAVTVCPTPYCRCRERESYQGCENIIFHENQDPNEQCHPTREGTLCGQCVNGTSVGVLRTNCRECTGDKFYAIPLLVVGDVLVLGVVFFVIMKLGFHFPYSLKGLLFYIQTAYYATDSFPASFWDVRKYMLFTSSALGLYFPYDFCLSPKMEALVTFAVKFIPPLLAFVMSVVIVVVVYVMRSRTGRSQVWRVIWFLILLLYAPLLHTCLAFLKCPHLPSSVDGQDKVKHWFFDGEVECFQSPAHIVLSTVAIVVLTPLVLLVPTVFTFIVVRYLRRDMNVRYRTVLWMTQALTEGYRDDLEAQCYAGWELTRRLLLVSIAVALPGRSVATVYVVIACFAVHVFFRPYKKHLPNVLETLVLLNYSLFLLVRSNQTILDAVSAGGYSGTQVPDTVGDSLPSVDSVAWLFIPPFYFPLVFTVVFFIGASAYRITKSMIQCKGKVETDRSSIYTSHYYFPSHSQGVSTTLVDGPS